MRSARTPTVSLEKKYPKEVLGILSVVFNLSRLCSASVLTFLFAQPLTSSISISISIFNAPGGLAAIKRKG